MGADLSDEAQRAPRSVADEQKGIEALLRPRSIVIIGMSLKPGSPSSMVIRNLVVNGFAGEIHLVGRSGGVVDGRTCHTSLSHLTPGIDLAVIMTPANAVPETLRDCVRHGVRSAICFASGFAEAGEHGQNAQAELESIARAGGLLLLGPNTVGYFNFVNPLLVSMVECGKIRPIDAEAGPGVGIVAQSGGIGIHIAETLDARRVPVSYNVTTGNEARIGLADMVRFYANDAHTGVVAIYAEQIRKPAALLEAVVEALTRGKPVVMFHPGRSIQARAAAASHTGALTGDYAAMMTVAGANGILVADALEELIDLSEILLRYPDAIAGGLGIVTGSGAICAIAEDCCDAGGMEVPPLTAGTLEALRELLPAYLDPRNPLDVGTAVGFKPDILGRALAVMAKDPAVGSIMLSLPYVRPPLDEAWMAGVASAVAQSRKPVVYVIHGEGIPLRAEIAGLAAERRIIVQRSPERAIRALAQLSRYSAARLRRSGRGPQDAAQRLELPQGTLAEWQGKQIIARSGIRVPLGQLARSRDEAASVASRIGFPLVMKAQASRLAHKSDAGGVLLGITSEAAVRNGWETLHANVRRHDASLELDGVLVEAMGHPGVELVVGGRRDPAWGVVVMVGMGGVWVEALGDVRLLPPGQSVDDIVQELQRLKSAKLLGGYRGSAAADLRAVADVVQKVAGLLEANPDIRDLEINPLVAYPGGVVALDVLIVVGAKRSGPNGSAEADLVGGQRP